MPSNIETWLPVVGWEGLYEVSDMGAVRSVRRTVVRVHSGKEQLFPVRERLLRPRVKSSGHLEVRLYRSGGGRGSGGIRHVHHLVLEAFVGPRPEGLECLHANDVPADNRVANLSWGSRRQNQLDLVRNGRNHNARKDKCINGHRFSAGNTRVMIRRSSGRQRRICVACARTRSSKSLQVVS